MFFSLMVKVGANSWANFEIGDIQTHSAPPIHNELLEDYVDIKCVDCGIKDLEIMNIKRKLLKSKSEEKITTFVEDCCYNLHVLGYNLCYHN